MNIGKSISNIRLSNKIARSDLARAVNISQSYLGQIENGAIPSMTVLLKICQFFKIPLSVLMWLSTENTDIPENKKELYRLFKIPIDSMMLELSKNEQKSLNFDK